MQITVNGEQREVPDHITIFDYITTLCFDPETVVVDLDGAIIKREEYQSKQLAEGCVLELIRFIGGG
jgi:sulfur carrier protein